MSYHVWAHYPEGKIQVFPTQVRDDGLSPDPPYNLSRACEVARNVAEGSVGVRVEIVDVTTGKVKYAIERLPKGGQKEDTALL